MKYNIVCLTTEKKEKLVRYCESKDQLHDLMTSKRLLFCKGCGKRLSEMNVDYSFQRFELEKIKHYDVYKGTVDYNNMWEFIKHNKETLNQISDIYMISNVEVESVI